ncbi:MAG TPA: tRNA (adenine-N1)-methyltransferase [Candidatus Nanopelagicaceae bacterium]
MTAQFQYGDRVQLTDAKGKLHTITLKTGGEWHTHKGWLIHDQIVGLPQGSVIETTAGLKFLAFKPLLGDYVLSMPRGATIVYPKDAALIVGFADIAPSVRVLEAGVGSGALTISLLRAVGPAGYVDSFERRPEFAEIATRNVNDYFNGKPENWTLTLGSVQEKNDDVMYDRIVLDMLAPWECIELADKVLHPGGVLLAYVATTTQLSVMAEAIKSSGRFTEPESNEALIRGWHHEGLAVRPVHRMIGHTGFLIQARRLAPGVTAPLRRRRPSKGAYGLPEDESVI